jgi:tripartite-type tricarboxylate transporter receptor subunit TctC
MIAAGQIAKAAPDGYTLHITTGAHIANAFVAKDLPYDVIKDFAPVTQLPRPMDLRSLRTYR